MSNIDKQALRDAASTAISAITRLNYATDSGSADADAVRAYHALAHPEAVLALLDELEALEAQSAVQLEALNNRVSEIGTLRYRIKTLNGTVDIVDGQRDLWMDRCKDAEAKLEAAEKRIVEMEVLRYPMIVIDIDGGSAVCVPDAQHSERFEWTPGQWAEHVGGHYQGNDPANYYEFGSFKAVASMLSQFGTVQQKIGWNACRAAMLSVGGISGESSD